MDEVPSRMTPAEREAFWADVAQANVEAMVARKQAEIDAILAAMPWWQRALVRLAGWIRRASDIIGRR